MSAYVIMFRDSTHDPDGLKTYAELASRAPAAKIELVASSKLGRYRVLEGDTVEAAVILRFPEWEDALEWYESPEYQAARKHRLASGTFRAVLIEGMPAGAGE